MVESKSHEAAIGVGTFFLAEAVLLAVGKYKFENVWKLVGLTPAAMAAGGLAGYCFAQKPAEKATEVAAVVLKPEIEVITIDNITVEEIDRVERLVLEVVTPVAARLVATGEQEYGGSLADEVVRELDAKITDKDRVGLVCFLARATHQWWQERGVRGHEWCLATLHASTIAVNRGWLNDPVWVGEEGAPRGKLLITLVPPHSILSGITDGMDPTLVDCEGVSGFSRVRPPAVDPAVGLDLVTIDEMDRLEAVMREDLQQVFQLHSGELDNDQVRDIVRPVLSRIFQQDRVPFTCLVARLLCQYEQQGDRHGREACFEVRCMAFKGFEIVLQRGWTNDPVWNGEEDSPRGKLLGTLALRLFCPDTIVRGMDPSLADCDGLTPFGLMPSQVRQELEKWFVKFGNQQSVIHWLSTLPLGARRASFVTLADLMERSEVVAWLEENSHG